jgi:Rad3-related DNA helicase
VLEEINEKLDQIIKEERLGKGFQFRTGQRETITAICKTYFEDPKATIVIDAPTGTGKSIIAMASSLVLSGFDKQGYLITSDLSLQDQYESDFYRLGLHWPSVKGADNYECSVNNLPFSLGDCRLKGMGYEQASKLDCYGSCDYLQNRQRAINHRVCLLNYAFWLLQRNYVEDKKADEGGSPFAQRDFAFFDEAHKVDEIVQNHFSPRVDSDISSRIQTVNSFLMKWGFSEPKVTKNRIDSVINMLLNETDNKKIFEAMGYLKQYLGHYNSMNQDIKSAAKKRFSNGLVPKDWQNAMTALDRIKDVYCKFDDYIDIIAEVGLDKMVVDQNREEAKFTCIEEQWMIRKHLHSKADFKVFMSATIGDPASYMRIMGIENARFIRLTNDFNYDKSPIVFINKHRMSMREKEASLPKVLEMLDKIIDKHKGQRGVIHCGSYEFMNYIMAKSKHTFRLINYENSKDKAGALELFKKKEGSVLVGPSILEGLDLKDDTSRFQIFFKVPYPSLNSPHIKAKMKYMPDWYDWKTSVSFLQGVGRSVRSKDDWAVTYMLDACFRGLISKVPKDIKSRIKMIE